MTVQWHLKTLNSSTTTKPTQSCQSVALAWNKSHHVMQKADAKKQKTYTTNKMNKKRKLPNTVSAQLHMKIVLLHFIITGTFVCGIPTF